MNPAPQSTCLRRTLSFAVALVAAVSLPGAVSDPLRTALDAFTGEWEGEIRIQALDGFLLRSLPIERRYSWDGDVQVVETRFVDDGATYEVRARQSVALGRLRSVVNRPGQPPEEYQGALAEGGISWINSERNTRDYKERIITRGGQPLLEASSFEVVRLKVVSGLARVNLALRPKAVAAPVIAAPAVVTTPPLREDPALLARIAQLERDLAAARDAATEREHEATGLSARLAELEREATSTLAARTAAESEVARLGEQLATARTAATSASGAGAAAAAERDALAARIKELERALLSAQAGAASRPDNTAALTARIADLEHAQAAVWEARRAAEASVTRLREELATAQAAGSAAASASAAVAGERDAFAARVKELEAGAARAIEAERARAAAETRVRSLESSAGDTAELTRARAAAEARVRELEASLATARQDLRKHAETSTVETLRLQGRLGEAESARRKLDARVSTLESERDALQARLAQAPDAAAFAADLERARADAASAMRQAERLLVERDALTTRAADAERRASELQTQIAEASRAGQDADAARTRLTAQEKELADLRARIAQAGLDADALRLSIEESRRQRDALAARLAESEKREQAATAEAGDVADVRRQLATLQGSRDNAVAEAAELRRQLAETQKAREQAVTDAATIREQLSLASAARDQAAIRATDLSGRIETLGIELEKARTTAGTGTGRLAQLERERAAADDARTIAEATVTRARDELAAAIAKSDAATAENTRLAARARELEASSTAGSAAARERDALAARVRELEAAAVQLGDLRRERDGLAARLADLEKRADITADALGRERESVRARLERSEGERLDAVGRAAELEQRLAEAGRRASEATASETALADLRAQLARAQSDTDAAMRQALKVLNERDVYAGRLADIERSASAALASLEESRGAAAAATGRANSAEVRSRELEATVAALTRVRESLDNRLAEQNRGAAGASAEADSLLRAERERALAEVGRLDRRVIELESERNSLRGNQALLQKQLQEATRLRDDTVARFEDVVSQLNAVREERDRLARANTSLQAEMRAARAAANVPASPPAARAGRGTAPSLEDDPEGALLSRLRAAVQGGQSGQGATAAGSGGEAAAERTAENLVNSFVVVGVTRSAGEDKVILDGRVHRNGDLVDAALGLLFVRIDGDWLLFRDRAGKEYRRRY